MTHFTERPCAAPGLISYRARLPFGFVMIGARDHADALREARRSNEAIGPHQIEIWTGSGYAPISPLA